MASQVLPPDEALRQLWERHQKSPSASLHEAIQDCLLNTQWQKTTLSFPTGMTIDHLWCDAHSIWAALSDDRGSTAIRLETQPLDIASLLFPRPGSPIRSWHFSPNGKTVVIERDHIALLCDAQTLQPVRQLPALPAHMIPTSAVTFSPDSLLFAHASEEQNRMQWTIRDAQHGEIIRSYPIPEGESLPLAGNMTRAGLDLLYADGRVLHVPLNPVSPPGELKTECEDLIQLAGALPTGGFLALRRPAPHVLPDTTRIHPHSTPCNEPTAIDAWLQCTPWTRHPSVWQSGYAALSPSTHSIPDTVSALMRHQGNTILGTNDGTIASTTTLPSLDGSESPPPRRAEFPEIDLMLLAQEFPELRFHEWLELEKITAVPVPPVPTMTPVKERMDRAFTAIPCPDVDLTFDRGVEKEVIALIQSSAPHGPHAAACLHHSLLSPRVEWIAACLSSYPDMPASLTRLAKSRIAWLSGHRSDVIGAWPDPFPPYDEFRATEDWEHWESVDFRVPFEQIRQSVAEMLDALRLPPEAPAQKRDEVFAQLTNEGTLASLGRERYAAFCLEAASHFAERTDEAERALILSNIALTMGAPPAPCMRVEALALTAQQNYPDARTRWVNLITHFPVSAHTARDYAEAAYCAFENHDSQQAMALLATGIHRFPADSSFALRAGWIALLTGYYESAWRFLTRGHQAGYAEQKIPHALALLAIASHQSGAPDESAAYHAELLRIDPSWGDPSQIKALQWPEEFTTVLLELAGLPPLTPDR